MKEEKKATPALTIKKVIAPKREETSIRLKTENPKVRYLKLKAFYRESRSKFQCNPSPTIVPELRLCGKWFQEAGFLPNNYVSVIVMDGLILIRSASEQISG